MATTGRSFCAVGGQHRGERARHAVGVADGIEAEFAVRCAIAPTKPMPPGTLSSSLAMNAAVGEDQIGPDDLRDVGFESVLPRELDDRFGFAACRGSRR